MPFRFLFSFLVVLLLAQTVEPKGEEVFFREWNYSPVLH